jgi:hypothetical protein
MSGIRRLTRAGLVALAATVGVLGAISAPASAGIGHKFLSQLTEIPAGPGVAVSGAFGNPTALTFDGSTLYVLDNGNSTVDEFDSSNNFVKQLPGVQGSSMAVDHATGEIYVYNRNSGRGVVDVFSPTGELLGEWTGADTPQGTFEETPGSVAVDNSTNPSDPAAGDVFVAIVGQGGVSSHGFLYVFRPEAGGKEKYLTQLTGAGVPEGAFSSALVGCHSCCGGR